MRILSVVGARPQFVKVAPVDEKLKAQGHEHIIVHTGQHYDYEMSKAFFEQLSIPEPDYNLEVGSGTHAQQTGRMLTRLGEVIAQEEPDLVLIYGDTNSTVAGALAAVKLRIPVGHVEAGFRSFDRTMPEEINRVVADSISQLLFAPTKKAVSYLINEGIDESRIVFVGNIMAETLLKNLPKASSSDILERFGLEPGSYAVMTCHRQENTEKVERLARILRGVSTSPVKVVFPVHPRTRKLLETRELAEIIKDSTVRVVEPLPYLDFLKLESEALFLITDSGGVQEEALVLQKPCITLRYNTEHTETIEAGCNVLVGAETELIEREIKRAVERAKAGRSYELPPFWDEKVSDRIVQAIEEKYDTARKMLEIPEEFGFVR